MIKIALVAFGVGVLYLAWAVWFLTKEETQIKGGDKQWKKQK